MHLSRLSIQTEGCLLYREDTWADRSLVIVLHVYYLLLVSKLAYRTILMTIIQLVLADLILQLISIVDSFHE